MKKTTKKATKKKAQKTKEGAQKVGSRPSKAAGKEEVRSASPYHPEISVASRGNCERPRPDSCDSENEELVVGEEKFQPGQIVAAPRALATLEASGEALTGFRARHIAGDCGATPLEQIALGDDLGIVCTCV
jgi:hypothetical protein